DADLVARVARAVGLSRPPLSALCAGTGRHVTSSRTSHLRKCLIIPIEPSVASYRHQVAHSEPAKLGKGCNQDVKAAIETGLANPPWRASSAAPRGPPS